MKFTKEIYPKDVLQDVLSSPIPYTDKDEEKLTSDLFNTLAPEDIPIAAQGSYAYWVAYHSDTPPTEEQTKYMAIRECRRHIYRVKYENAVVNIKETCKYRKERRIELFRAAFTEGVEFDNEEDAQFVENLKKQVTTDMAKQASFVRGKDKDGRALLIVRPRTDKNTVEEEFITMLIYVMERAVAATEFVSRGLQEKILVVLDFGTFKASTAPPMSAAKAMISILQNRYSERLKNLVVIDPPLWMRTMYGLLKPFLDPVTKAKFIVASGDKKKQETIATFVDPEQAMPFMLPDGKLVGEFDLDHFVYKVPFHCLYDEAKVGSV